MKQEHELSSPEDKNTNSNKIFNEKLDLTTCLNILSQMVSFSVFFLVISRLGKNSTKRS
jgi:hypothetical protein